MNKYKIFVFIGIVILTFQTCKKGEEDPLISLRSRTNRLVGRWELKKLNGYIDFYDKNDQKMFWIQCLVDPELFSSMRYSKTSYSTYYYGYYFTFKNISSHILFDKNATTKLEISSTNKSTTTYGSWYWNNDLGENKEYIYISDLNLIMQDYIYYASDLSHFLYLPVNFEDFDNIHYFKINALSNSHMELTLAKSIEDNPVKAFPKVNLIFQLEFEKQQ